MRWVVRRISSEVEDVVLAREVRELRKRAAQLGVLHGIKPRLRGGYRIRLYGAEDLQVFDEDELLLTLRALVRGAEAALDIMSRI